MQYYITLDNSKNDDMLSVYTAYIVIFCRTILLFVFTIHTF